MIEKMENKKEVEEKRIRARGGMGILLLLLPVSYTHLTLPTTHIV